MTRIVGCSVDMISRTRFSSRRAIHDRRPVGNRNRKAKQRSADGAVHRRHLPAMRLNDSTRDSQPKADAAPALFGVDPEKLLENALLGAGRQPWSMIGHFHDH